MIYALKIVQPDAMLNIEYFQNEKFLKAYKEFFKILLKFLNGTNVNIDNDITDLLDLSYALASVN